MQRRIQVLPANEPADAWVRLFMVQAAFCHEWLGQKEEARQLFERVVQETKPTPDTIVKPEANGLPSTLALAYAGLGEKEKALQQASSGSERLRNQRREQTGCGNRSRTNPGALRPDRRRHRSLTASLQVPAGLTVANLNYDPMWDPIRKDQRFQKLCGENPSEDRKFPSPS